MSLLSVRLSRALERGRAPRTLPQSRTELLRTLLAKRAAAHNAGAADLELLLRDQIRWSLPIERHGGDTPGSKQATRAHDHRPPNRSC